MTLKIYHNPRCSKSRNTLQIIQNAGIEPNIVRYLDEAPSAVEILDLAQKLGGKVADLLRRGEAEFKTASDLPDLDDDKALAAWIEVHPKVLERPIVVDTNSGRAIMGRPPENVKQLLS